MDWTDAKQHCESLTGQLMVIKTQADVDAFLQAITAAGYQYDRFWVGARDQEGDGQFTYVDGTPLASDSALWYPNEPNGGDCVQYGTYGDPNVGFQDNPCLGTDKFVCEIFQTG